MTEPSPATNTPEARGLARDEVRLLVLNPSQNPQHTQFRRIGEHFRGGDLLLINTSMTVPGRLEGLLDNGQNVVVHFSGMLENQDWIVELRDAAGDEWVGNNGTISDRSRVTVANGLTLHVVKPYRAGNAADTIRLWQARPAPPMSSKSVVYDFLHDTGSPIRYSYMQHAESIDFYQTVYGRHPGSSEMPSAGRPFTEQLVIDLLSQGIYVAPVTLHTGVSSQEKFEHPYPEEFIVPSATASLTNFVRYNGGRIIAVGTTVARAIESSVDGNGTVMARSGWTNRVISSDAPAEIVHGIITGFHPKDSTHAELLEGIVGRAVFDYAHAIALDHGYMMHEFGDSCLMFAS